MLYEGAIRFLQQAIDAMYQMNVEARYEKLTRAGEIILALQSALDIKNGGEQAKGLYDFYASLDMRILTLHRHNDTMAVTRIISELKQIRDVWDAIDRGELAS